jgi:hypothetical protein
MKSWLQTSQLAFCILAGSLTPVCATDDLFANVLIKYDFNALTADGDPNTPSYCAPCVYTTDLSLNTLNQGLHDGGPDGSKFRCFEGWDSAYNYDFHRTDFSQSMNTLSHDLFVRPGSIAEIAGVSFDWQRPGSTSANALQASIFWEDSSGLIQYRTSGPVSLTGTGSWNRLDLDFTSGSSALPTGIDTSGKQFHIELYAWGQDGGVLYLDNVVLKGDCAPIPEPSGAILIAAAAGLALLLRRRHAV